MNLETPLFKAATAAGGKLRQPTHSEFDPRLWLETFKDIETRSVRDCRLIANVFWYGEQLQTLRRHFQPMFDGLGNSHAIALLAATANHNFVTALHHARKNMRSLSKSKDAIHIESASRALVFNPRTQQSMDPDGIFEMIVDALPSWVYNANNCPEISDQNTFDAQSGPKIILYMSLENSLRTLWLQCLWNGAYIEKVGDDLVHRPLDRAQEEMWQAWVIREQALGVQRGFYDGVLFHGKRAPRPKQDPLIARSVTSIEHKGAVIVPQVGLLERWGEPQKAHYAGWSVLTGSYMARSLHEPLPKFSPLEISLSDIYKAWCVVKDLVRVALELDGKRLKLTRYPIRQRALAVDSRALEGALSLAMGVGPKVAQSIIRFLTINSTDMSRVFNNGFWSSPLIQDDRLGVHYLIGVVLEMGNPLRAAESWLARGHGAKGLEIKGTGFEIEMRERLATDLKSNSLVKNAKCPLSDLPSRKNGEEIDGLIALKDKLLVLEAKCFITPESPIERFNYINRLERACAQVKRKAEWISSRLDMIKDVFSINYVEDQIIGVVVVNSSFGLGFAHEDVPVVDLHYLSLICGDGKYESHAAIKRDTGEHVSAFEILYRDEDELANNIVELLNNPRPMNRFRDCFTWRREPFPTAYGARFFIEMPTYRAPPSVPHVISAAEELWGNSE